MQVTGYVSRDVVLRDKNILAVNIIFPHVAQMLKKE